MKYNKKLFGTLLVLFGSVCWGIGGVAGESLLKTDYITTTDIIPIINESNIDCFNRLFIIVLLLYLWDII